MESYNVWVVEGHLAVGKGTCPPRPPPVPPRPCEASNGLFKLSFCRPGVASRQTLPSRPCRGLEMRRGAGTPSCQELLPLPHQARRSPHAMGAGGMGAWRLLGVDKAEGRDGGNRMGHSGNTVKPWLVHHSGGHLSLSIPFPSLGSLLKRLDIPLYPAGDSGPLSEPSRPGILKLPTDQCPLAVLLSFASVRGRWQGLRGGSRARLVWDGLVPGASTYDLTQRCVRKEGRRVGGW
ncbi:hypothetical protein E2C01_054956 [Portunus trituberculatus]|uniref:Uncharacterized protein n=1 Tax=Portunus trituberculatus TaxID=210409 RepID=A0A5B7GU09_PORTR|nr:hypothetical protein [Portunus trituberculatus]